MMLNQSLLEILFHRLHDKDKRRESVILVADMFATLTRRTIQQLAVIQAIHESDQDEYFEEMVKFCVHEDRINDLFYVLPQYVPVYIKADNLPDGVSNETYDLFKQMSDDTWDAFLPAIKPFVFSNEGFYELKHELNSAVRTALQFIKTVRTVTWNGTSFEVA